MKSEPFEPDRRGNRHGLALFVAVLMACIPLACKSDSTTGVPDQPRPAIAYFGTARDTVGVAAFHAVHSSGGAVSHYAVEPALPHGLQLDSVSGSISGTPSAPSSATDYHVIASGPGGSDTATLRLQVVSLAPVIEYDSPFLDSLYVAVFHPVISTGGAITKFSVSPALPFGLSLDTTTGTLSGTPSAAMGPTAYTIIAEGPKGRDTAEVEFEVVNAIYGSVALYASLDAAPGYTLGRMIVTATSGVSSDAVMRDTLFPGQNGFTASGNSSQVVAKTWMLRPLRSWTFSLRVLDARDSVLYGDSVVVPGLVVRETRAVTRSLKPRYAQYAVSLVLPDSLRSLTGGAAQKMNFNRFRVKLDGRVARDSVRSAGYFDATPTVHQIAFPDVPVSGAHAIGVEVFGSLPGWSSGSPLYSGTITVDAADTTYNVTLPWTGPGSSSDPNADPLHPANIAGLVVAAAKVTTVTFEPVIPGPLLKRSR